MPGRPGRDREDPVEQHDALIRPRGEVAGAERLARVGLELPRDVRERARHRPSGRDRKAAGPSRRPGVGYGSWPTISTRTSANGRAKGAKDARARGKVVAARRELGAQEVPSSASVGATGSRTGTQSGATVLHALDMASAYRSADALANDNRVIRGYCCCRQSMALRLEEKT